NAGSPARSSAPSSIPKAQRSSCSKALSPTRPASTAVTRGSVCLAAARIRRKPERGARSTSSAAGFVICATPRTRSSIRVRLLQNRQRRCRDLGDELRELGDDMLEARPAFVRARRGGIADDARGIQVLAHPPDPDRLLDAEDLVTRGEVRRQPVEAREPVL